MGLVGSLVLHFAHFKFATFLISSYLVTSVPLKSSQFSPASLVIRAECADHTCSCKLSLMIVNFSKLGSFIFVDHQVENSEDTATGSTGSNH